VLRTVGLNPIGTHTTLIQCVYFLRFPARVVSPGSDVAPVFEVVLGAEVSLGEAGDGESKLNLKREDRDGVDGAVATD
jgi:hypothetical protein